MLAFAKDKAEQYNKNIPTYCMQIELVRYFIIEKKGYP